MPNAHRDHVERSVVERELDRIHQLEADVLAAGKRLRLALRDGEHLGRRIDAHHLRDSRRLQQRERDLAGPRRDVEHAERVAGRKRLPHPRSPEAIRSHGYDRVDAVVHRSDSIEQCGGVISGRGNHAAPSLQSPFTASSMTRSGASTSVQIENASAA